MLDLLEWSGGFKSDAYLKQIELKRWVDDEEKLILIDYRDLKKNKKDFKLLDGDRIMVPYIPIQYQNFVQVGGAVNIPGEYELNPGMRVSDLLAKAQLADNALLETAFIYRFSPDGITDYKQLDLKAILKSPGSAEDILLLPKDDLKIFAGSKFTDTNFKVMIAGSVRDGNSYDYKPGMKVSEIVALSGGLTESSLGYGYLKRKNLGSLENPFDYIKVDFRTAFNNPKSAANIELKPKDELKVFAADDFIEQNATIDINGAVLSPGTYDYDGEVTLKDIMTMSGGIKMSGDASRVNIYRVDLSPEGQGKTEEITLEIDKQFNVLGEDGGDNYLLRPYDQIFVRELPEFRLQENVTIQGEVRWPGNYALTKDNEKISDIIKRSGGFTDEAFEEGITLFRSKDSLGYLVIDAQDLLNNPNSPSNYILKPGDRVIIPKISNVVGISGAVKSGEVLQQYTIGTRLNVPFHEGKNALFYIENYAGGIDRKAGARKRLIQVRQPGGRLDKVRNYGLFKIYPEVQKGAEIFVGAEVKEVDEEGREKEKIDWGSVISNTVTQATAILTLVILIQQIQ